MTSIVSQVASALSLAGASAIFLWALNCAMRAPWRKLSYPPGPPSKGIISGNKSDVSVPLLWRVCAEWANIYGAKSLCCVYSQNVLSVH
jgi:hypothetical protein